MVICLEQGADLRMAQLMPLPLTVSCFSKIQIGFTFLVLAHPGSPGKRAGKRVCVWLLCLSLTGSSDEESVVRNGDVDRRQATSAAAGPSMPPGLPVGMAVDADAMRSRQLPPPPTDRSLPRPPAVRELQNVDPEVNASRQSFRLAMGNACELDEITRVGLFIVFFKC